MTSHQYNSKSKGPVLLLKTIFSHVICSNGRTDPSGIPRAARYVCPFKQRRPNNNLPSQDAQPSRTSATRT